MALNHNDVELPELIINHFNTLADYQAAYQGGFISGTDITFIDENIQPDWDETDSGSPAYIKNKPVISGGSTSVQSNWNQNDPSAADYIKNKPTIPASVTGTNDGTNWTTITIGSTTKNIPSGGGGGGSSTLAGLTDTTISSPSSGQILAYDSSTSKWINSAPERELFVCTMTYLNSVYSCDKTWEEIYAAYNDGKLPILVYDSNIYQCSQIGDTFGSFSYSTALNYLSVQRTAIQMFFYDGNGDLLPQGWTHHSINSVPFSTSDKTKLDNIASGADVNVQADWAETGTTNDAYIKNKPTIGNGVLTIQKNGTKVDAFSANQTTNTTIDITVPTTASDINALPSSTKYASSLSLSMDPTTFVVTGQLKDQDNNNLGSAQTLDLPLETMVVGGHYNSGTQKVVLELKSGSTVEFSVADLVSGLVNETTFNNHVASASHVTTAQKNTWDGKQDSIDDLSQIRSNAASGWSAYQTVTAHTGSTTLHLPTVTSTDSGKILQVSSAGTWQLVSPVTIYSGTGTPAQNLGKDGDIYIQTT